MMMTRDWSRDVTMKQILLQTHYLIGLCIDAARGSHLLRLLAPFFSTRWKCRQLGIVHISVLWHCRSVALLHGCMPPSGLLLKSIFPRLFSSLSPHALDNILRT